jgi:exonuclease SbcD
MKILHFADLHLGVESYGRIDPATGMLSRLGDFLQALDEVVDFAINNDVDLVLFCGDAYKSRNPTPTQQREFAKRVKRLTSGGIPVFLLVGNHDLPSAIGRATSMEIFHTLKVENVFVANQPGTWRIETKSGVIQLVALPWMQRSTLLSYDEYKNLTIDQLNRKMESIVTEWLATQVQSLAPELPAILAAHIPIWGADMGSERGMLVGRELTLLRSNIALPAFDYVALGHIHKHQVLGQSPPAVYPGSLSSIDFSDEGQGKGFYVVNLEGKRALSYDFHPVKTRRFLTINVDASAENPTATVLQALAQREVEDAIVRVRIRVPASGEGLIQDAEIHRALREAHFVTIAKEMEREHRIRISQHPVESVLPLEALKLYLESKKTPAERTRILLEYGERLISTRRAA